MKELGAWVGDMEKLGFVLKVVVLGAGLLSWESGGSVELCDKERMGTLECVRKTP